MSDRAVPDVNPPARLDADAVRELEQTRLDWRFKAVPPEADGLTVRQYLERRPRLSDLGTPLLTLDAGALDHNTRTVADWARESGVLLAPHGKTTMAPQLWQRQLAAGAWAITVANLPQLRVARAFGVSRLLLANPLLDPAGLAWVAREFAADPGFSLLCWADGERAVALMDEALRAAGAERPMEVCVELGGPGGRTGARDEETALRTAEAVRRSPVLALAGVGGYEAAVAGEGEADTRRAAVDAYLHRLARVHRRLADRGDYGDPAARAGSASARPVLTAGGSCFPDQVAEVLGGAAAETGAVVVIRSGAYQVHDDGLYRDSSPFGRPGSAGAAPGAPALRSAMHAWSRVLSRPEPGLALLDGGRRDLSFDAGLPAPQLVRGGPVLAGEGAAAEVTALNDQHAFVRGPGTALLRVGDVVRLGLSHPCTVFDRWTLIPVLDDADAADPAVVDLVRTFF